jgi:hypothetical protein
MGRRQLSVVVFALAFVVLVFGAVPAWADGEMTASQARALIRETLAIQAEFPLSAAADCDADEQGRRSRGTTGDWTEGDAKCNENIERIAAVLSMWSGGTLPWADAVTAWCAAAALVVQAREILGENPRDRIERWVESPEQRQKMIGYEMMGAAYPVFVIMNTTIGFVNTTIFFNMPQ